MRIGIDYRPVTAAPTSGIARQVLALEQVLGQLPGSELVRFTAAQDGHAHRAVACCPPLSIPSHGLHRPGNRLRFEARFLPQALRAQGIDVYIATANSGLPLRRPLTLRRQVLLLHDLFQLTLPGRHVDVLRKFVYRAMDRLAIGHAVRAADVIWTPSLYSAAEIARLFPHARGKLRVLPNAVLPLPAPAAHEPGLPSRYWLVVGSREPRKNLPFFLDAWRRARNAAPQDVPELVVVGQRGDVPASLADATGLHWYSGIADERLSCLYHEAERLWHPAWAEGFGLPVVEALGCGTPVAVAHGSALDEVAPQDAPHFDPYDGSALEQLLIGLARTRRNAGESPEALRDFAGRFGLDAYAHRVAELVEELRR
jgi:glycosyltransferase involved in cell wall biosynthesis